ncbi:S-DNA-T family DNA segregation ATPase FtsK/SpoIIIE [Antricoccus suffuscus]|uniref:S-DNA-T family DNA segregation ATPase FtsK/SpoIIIE n=1 Tax=Antricoccus suffuscus TaxID=1629062 RepID=A0A2T1A369_9ACTN|nr:type VII secretion protein EccCb [Antricoccus suffuscus]PRZ43052.1 S-DNA-T family DNA segregation ATPase FtsK/SpoIIIE [Antricoccus suffuscus]
MHGAADSTYDEIVLRAPPTVPDANGAGGLMTALPAMGGLGSVAYMFAGPRHPATYIAGGAFLLLSLGMVVGLIARGRGSKKQGLARKRRSYDAYLRGQRAVVRDIARMQRAQMNERFPTPQTLCAIAPSIKPRNAGDRDFGALRFGVAAQPLMAVLRVEPDGSESEPDIASVRQLDLFIQAHSSLPDLPTTISVYDHKNIRIAGTRQEVLGLGRALITHAGAFHRPGGLSIYIYSDEISDWEWAKWLPHTHGRIAVSPMDLVERLRHEAGHSIVLTDGTPLTIDGGDRVTVIHLGAASTYDAQLHIEGGYVTLRRDDAANTRARADSLSAAEAEAVARAIARRYAEGAGVNESDNSLYTLLKIPGIRAIDVEAIRANARNAQQRLTLPMGTTTDLRPLFLDIKEPAQGGIGPHGLVVGATGSGKSELLRTMVLGAAATHPPDLLNFVLVDFKGGATFADMSGIPHTSALITNLQDDIVMVDRMRDALASELSRRQRLLSAAGHATSIGEYAQRRSARPDLPPLPSLVIVVDEFTELLAQQPDFIDVFVQIGRLGRSLGIHLLLATQHLDEARVRGLESHLSYRIALRTFSAGESRAAIGVPDASELPSAPGHALLRSDSTSLIRFKAAHTLGHVASAPAAPNEVTVERFSLLGSAKPSHDKSVDKPFDKLSGGLTGDNAALLIAALTCVGEPAHKIWLPPLDLADPLDAMHPTLATRTGRGYGADPARPPLVVPIGTVDEPLQQRRSRLAVDFSRAGSHLAVVGAPRSGKSSLLRTIVLAAALRHTPAEANFYLLDFSDGSLAALEPLPHTGNFTAGRDPEMVRRTVQALTDLIATREGAPTYDGADTFLVIDGYAGFSHDFEELSIQVRAIAERGAAYGVHLVLSTHRWSDLRHGLRDLFGTRLELKLGDSLDSDISRRAQEAIPADTPGRGLTPDGRHFLAAVPRADRTRGITRAAAAERALVSRIARDWHGPAAPHLEPLPSVIPLETLTYPHNRICLGLNGRTFEPLCLDPDEEIGLVTLGDPASGKTSLLRSIGCQVQDTFPAGTAKLVVIDYRRDLFGDFDDAAILGYAATKDHANELITGVCDGLAARLPTNEATETQLRDRNWWSGPQIYVLVNDYDLVANTAAHPLLPLLEYLPHARDVGLRVFLTRRAAGATRAALDPIVAQLIELQTPTLLLSAPPDEGRIFGVPASRQVPGRGTYAGRTVGTLEVQVAYVPRRSPL